MKRSEREQKQLDYTALVHATVAKIDKLIQAELSSVEDGGAKWRVCARIFNTLFSSFYGMSLGVAEKRLNEQENKP